VNGVFDGYFISGRNGGNVFNFLSRKENKTQRKER